MLNQVQLQRMYEKQKTYVDRMEGYIFKQVDTLEVTYYPTKEKLDALPTGVSYQGIKEGDVWGEEKLYAWFQGDYCVPEELDGQRLYLMPECGLYEGLLFVNGLPYANYASKFPMNTGHGNHYCKAFTQKAKKGEKINLVLEAYAGHDYAGCMPYEAPTSRDYAHKFQAFQIMVQDQLRTEFFYQYKIILELYEVSNEHSPKRAQLEQLLLELNKVVYFSNEETSDEVQEQAMKEALKLMEPIFKQKNSETTASVGILGHSHMDTAWLWEIDETIKKCARTFANQLNMMDQFPEYHFMQSSTAHLKFIEDHYPALFEEIKKKVATGQYEPNGGVFIECDCNITGGEFLIRHFLWGQRYTKEKFNYLSNSFFLPDTFGYSAAIPQILKGVGIDYFLTTKMGWNDTNKFPYVTYYWKGIDGSQVLAHHNITHQYPTPKAVTKVIEELPQKSVSNSRLFTYGFGDGGGGPEDSSAEIARRIHDVEGCPKVYDTTVAEFMRKLESELYDANVHTGELYLELHRGTLTNQHTIKRNNRKSEIAIHDAEYLTALKAVQEGAEADAAVVNELVETLLINQFHDILPGTSLPEVHDRSIRETTALIKSAQDIIQGLFPSTEKESFTLVNTLSFSRDDVVELPTSAYLAQNYPQQLVETIKGDTVLRVAGIHLDAYGSVTLNTTSEKKEGKSAFVYENNTLSAPFAEVTFSQTGAISSFIDKRNNRQLKGEGYDLNTFLFGEDLPLLWDNWDIDADAEMKLKDSLTLVNREVVADGQVEFRIRSHYKLSEETTMVQDMIFYSDMERVDFETVLDWNDKHRFLKVAFDTTINSDFVTQEIQYGNVRRGTVRNNTIQQAQFEVCNHKYTDLSEPNYGISVLNDCKYGISAQGSQLALTLHKGGCKPDPRGDQGVHEFKYSFYPHLGGFRSETVTKNGYLFNYPAQILTGSHALISLLQVEESNVIVESIKPCEDKEKAVIVRLYESEGSYTQTALRFHEKIKSVTETDLLECPLPQQEDCHKLNFKAYQIRTLKLEY